MYLNKIWKLITGIYCYELFIKCYLRAKGRNHEKARGFTDHGHRDGHNVLMSGVCLCGAEGGDS